MEAASKSSLVYCVLFPQVVWDRGDVGWRLWRWWVEGREHLYRTRCFIFGGLVPGQARLATQGGEHSSNSYDLNSCSSVAWQYPPVRHLGGCFASCTQVCTADICAASWVHQSRQTCRAARESKWAEQVPTVVVTAGAALRHGRAHAPTPLPPLPGYLVLPGVADGADPGGATVLSRSPSSRCRGGVTLLASASVLCFVGSERGSIGR